DEINIARGWVGGGRNIDGIHRPARLEADLAAVQLARNEDDRINAFARPFDEPDLTKGRTLLGEYRLENLLGALVDGADDPHVIEERIPVEDDAPADQIGGERANERDADQCKDKPDARDGEG